MQAAVFAKWQITLSWNTKRCFPIIRISQEEAENEIVPNRSKALFVLFTNSQIILYGALRIADLEC